MDSSITEIDDAPVESTNQTIDASTESLQFHSFREPFLVSVKVLQ